MEQSNANMKRRRKKRLLKNSLSSLIFEITTVICGFILPRFILGTFGSEVNGLVNSITQFLHVIAFLELGVGSVVQSALFKPLADGDNDQISRVVVSADKFFRRLAMILLFYVAVLLVFYPMFAAKNFDHLYTALLIAAMSISSFCQYYFGIVNRLLLSADQRGYIQYNAQTITLVLNTIACVILIKLGASIQVVKLTTSLIFMSRPIVLHLYVNRKYNLNRKITYTGEPIKQKWNGVAQHLASFVLDGTANIILTLFATLSDVSIYSVYHLVLNGIKTLYTSMATGIRSLLGELWARQEQQELTKTFSWVEWSLNTGAVFIFGCTGTLLLPFVSVYTKGITDANYIQPLFALFITLAQAGHCLRLPYNMMILAAGHYKQTQSNYIIAALMNLGVSIIMVKLFGLVGVSIGALLAMAYQTVWMANYNSKNLLKWPFKNFLKQLLVDLLSVGLGVLGTCLFTLRQTTYFWWVILAVEHALVWLAVVVIVNMIFNREKMLYLFGKLKKITSFRKKAS